MESRAPLLPHPRSAEFNRFWDEVRGSPLAPRLVREGLVTLRLMSQSRSGRRPMPHRSGPGAAAPRPGSRRGP